MEREVVKHQATVQLKGLQKEKSDTRFSLAFDPLNQRDITGQAEGFQRNATESKPASLRSLNNFLTGISYTPTLHCWVFCFLPNNNANNTYTGMTK